MAPKPPLGVGQAAPVTHPKGCSSAPEIRNEDSGDELGAAGVKAWPSCEVWGGHERLGSQAPGLLGQSLCVVKAS